jgi:hypothetical protein
MLYWEFGNEAGLAVRAAAPTEGRIESMLGSSLATFVTAALLLVGASALALPPTTLPGNTGGGGIINDLCIRNPELCPPVEQPTDPTFSHHLAGSAKVTGDGIKTSQPYALDLNFDTSALTFLAMDSSGKLYSGNLVPKGTHGNKFRLFLDGSSSDAFAADVAGRAGDAAGRSAGDVLGESSKLTLKLAEDGSASLKIKSEVLVKGMGELGFQTSASSVAPTTSTPRIRATVGTRTNAFGSCSIDLPSGLKEPGVVVIPGLCCSLFSQTCQIQNQIQGDLKLAR